MIYACCNEVRKAAVRGSATLNGIDYLEILTAAQAAQLTIPPQQTLLVHCLNPLPVPPGPQALQPANVLIIGGESITGISPVWVAPAASPPPAANTLETAYFPTLPNAANILVIRTSAAGDFSPYELRLVGSAAAAQQDPFEITQVLPRFDPQLANICFSFKAECATGFDCAAAPAPCAPQTLTPPPINYLAKDYGSFRGVLIDRLSQLLPNWNGTSEADLAITLAELIAYAGDQLSYQQDAIATEAYLRTARSRVSLRRHAMLTGFQVQEGCNARAWVQIGVSAEVFLDHTQTCFYTPTQAMLASLATGQSVTQAALDSGATVFVPMQDAVLFPEHSEMQFYTWGDTDCCLQSGATEATLRGTYPNLQPGDVLIFQEVLGPQTGLAADADLRHRCAVRLTQVATTDAAGNLLSDPLFPDPATQAPQTVTEIQWAPADAPKFPICLSSSFTNSDGAAISVSNVSLVLGNIVLADHGLPVSGAIFGPVPSPRLNFGAGPAADPCAPSQPVPAPIRFRPILPNGPITRASPLALAGPPVTLAPVMLAQGGFASLSDAGGLVSFMIQAADPAGWPAWFGVIATPNTINAAYIDLAVVYAPGAAPPVKVEVLIGLSLVATDPNAIPTVIAAQSRFLVVSGAYTTPSPLPTAYPAVPAMLQANGATALTDAGGQVYLNVQPSNPMGWITSFGLLAQVNSSSPGLFNLSVVYNPPLGAIGVAAPVPVETFSNVSLSTVAAQFTGGSQLITVKSFEAAPNASLPAATLISSDPSTALPAITLTSTAVDGEQATWTQAADLLDAAGAATQFVVETESDGTAMLRFGDGINGQAPQPGMIFGAAYRIGNGAAGNVGAQSLTRLSAADARIQSCTNPLPASGGTDPQSAEQIRRGATAAFLSQRRAVTLADYQVAANANSQVEQSVAMLRWTGSWYTVFLGAQPAAGGMLSAPLQASLTQSLNAARLAGQDIKVESPNYLSLQIELQVVVDPAYFQADVRQALLQVLGNGILPNGQKGLFYPGSFTFGQTVYLSPIYLAARAVPGVLQVTATTFQPLGVNSALTLVAGQITLGAFQIAQLSNDPSRPDHGMLTLQMSGGK